MLMTVFKPETPGTNDGPRIWNSQLIRYAGHRGANETTVGDPAELGFTDAVKKYFDWSPKGGKDGQFDTFPILLQINEKSPPTAYTLPDECISEVPIHHPTIRGISQLGLRWYGVPAVSNITLDLGGLKYSAAPFNGWYMVTEIATRNFCDEGRYNLAARIAHAMGIDTSTNETLWKDHAIAAINLAVLHSFKRARVSIADHHTCAESFAQWYEDEKKTRGYVPGNWKWILPPTSASTNTIYLGLNKMTEYTMKPALVNGMSTNALVKRARDSGYLTNDGDQQGVSTMKVLHAAAKFRKSMKRVTGVVVLYASDGGRTQARASWFWSFVRQRFPMILPLECGEPRAKKRRFRQNASRRGVHHDVRQHHGVGPGPDRERTVHGVLRDGNQKVRAEREAIRGVRVRVAGVPQVLRRRFAVPPSASRRRFHRDVPHDNVRPTRGRGR